MGTHHAEQKVKFLQDGEKIGKKRKAAVSPKLRERVAKKKKTKKKRNGKNHKSKLSNGFMVNNAQTKGYQAQNSIGNVKKSEIETWEKKKGDS